ncbi:MAG TPA: TonB-dependent receptor plug domain-containing protein [Gemmatimonadales bacterium]|nr:TonB-dependent receptor plug domain-containing protein [Gemmatimonadales bacterium]
MVRRKGPLVAAVATLLFASRLSAQYPYDSLPADTLTRDTVNTTERYLKAQEANAIRLPVLPLVGVDGPRPAMSRVVFTSDSLEWALAETVSDILQRIPGVYLWRGGWLGRTEYPDYRGRGPVSAEYFVDGLRYRPIGPDSIGIDPSLFSLSLFDRIEIERWPALLRVYLFTRRHDRQSAGSRVGIASGDKAVARYVGALERRYKSGIGFALGGERMVAPSATGATSSFDITNIWLQLGYVPSQRFGVQAQFLSSSPNRSPYVSGVDTLELGTDGKRTDAELRVFWRRRPDDMGLRIDGLLGRTTWKGSGVDDQMRQGGLVIGYRTPTFGLSASGFNSSRITPWDFEGRAGWTPTGPFSLEVDAAYQRHDLDRQTRWVGARGSLGLPLGFEVQGTVRSGSFVAAPAILTDTAQSLTDWQGSLRWQRSWAGFELGYGRTAAFQSPAYRSFQPSVASFAPTAAANWVTLNWRLAPKQWLTFEGWYSDPAGKAPPDGIPATHSLTTGTIRSKFWRTFKSGIFDFKAQLAYETWGKGIIGRDSLGQAVALDGASFWRTEIEIRLDSFLLYWDRYNLQGSRKTYVPGFVILPFGSTFGVKWLFTN